jgi:hypothetical protein
MCHANAREGAEREGRGEGVRERKRECVYARASERV